MNPPPLLLSGDVARRLGVSLTVVHRLDDVLQPVRASRNVRVYDPEIVERVALEREARAAARAAARLTTTGAQP